MKKLLLVCMLGVSVVVMGKTQGYRYESNNFNKQDTYSSNNIMVKKYKKVTNSGYKYESNNYNKADVLAGIEKSNKK